MGPKPNTALLMTRIMTLLADRGELSVRQIAEALAPEGVSFGRVANALSWLQAEGRLVWTTEDRYSPVAWTLATVDYGGFTSMAELIDFFFEPGTDFTAEEVMGLTGLDYHTVVWAMHRLGRTGRLSVRGSGRYRKLARFPLAS